MSGIPWLTDIGFQFGGHGYAGKLAELAGGGTTGFWYVGPAFGVITMGSSLSSVRIRW
jgi:hypothetical protein